MESLSGRHAVARLTQGIPPKHCALPARRAEGCWGMSSSANPRPAAALEKSNVNDRDHDAP